MTDKQTANSLGNSNQSLPITANSNQSLPKGTRIYISRPQHYDLLRSVSAQLGSNNLRDGLEHILNCWLVGNIPTGSSVIQSPVQTAIGSEDVDEFDSLISFE